MPDTTLLLAILQVALGIAFLKGFGKPQPTREFRLRFRVAVISLSGIALLGLRPLLHVSAAHPWARYAAIYQCIFNLAVTGVLLLRYRLYMPRKAPPLHL